MQPMPPYHPHESKLECLFWLQKVPILPRDHVGIKNSSDSSMRRALWSNNQQKAEAAKLRKSHWLQCSAGLKSEADVLLLATVCFLSTSCSGLIAHNSLY